MDRRQQKTREAIFGAFSQLLSVKNYHQISVQEIIDKANVGRTTFYAHFETKDYLLKEMCEELFNHIIDTAMGQPHGQTHDHSEQTKGSVFLHLIQHLQENDRDVLGLLSSDNNVIFLKYFKENLKRLVVTQYADKDMLTDTLPEEYLVNHISAAFVETVSWWVSRQMQETPEEITAYFFCVTQPLIR